MRFPRRQSDFRPATVPKRPSTCESISLGHLKGHRHVETRCLGGLQGCQSSTGTFHGFRHELDERQDFERSLASLLALLYHGSNGRAACKAVKNRA